MLNGHLGAEGFQTFDMFHDRASADLAAAG